MDYGTCTCSVICLSDLLASICAGSYRSKWIFWGGGWCEWKCCGSSSWRPGAENSASAEVQWISGQSQAGISEEKKEWEIAKGSPAAVARLVEQTLQVAIPIGMYSLYPCSLYINSVPKLAALNLVLISSYKHVSLSCSHFNPRTPMLKWFVAQFFKSFFFQCDLSSNFW